MNIETNCIISFNYKAFLKFQKKKTASKLGFEILKETTTTEQTITTLVNGYFHIVKQIKFLDCLSDDPR